MTPIVSGPKWQPHLVRISTLSYDFIKEHINIINTPIKLNVGPEIDQMCQNWLPEEVASGRRLVHLQVARTLNATISISGTPLPSSYYSRKDKKLVVSCVYWEEKKTYVVTSVDVIHVLEYLVGEPFSTEEKSRVRRNLQFLKPYTITRSGSECRGLFNSLMLMENPRPRHIEKDLKVFKWSDLFVAANKALTKYSANPNHTSLRGPEAAQSFRRRRPGESALRTRFLPAPSAALSGTGTCKLRAELSLLRGLRQPEPAWATTSYSIGVV